MKAEPTMTPDALAATLDSIREGVQIIGFDWRYIYANAAVCRHGRRPREDLIGRTMMEVFPGIDGTDMFRVLRECMAERCSRELDNEFHYPDGSKASFELRVQPCAEGIFVLSVDITERKRLEIALRHAQKMEAVGGLAGGVAHDFNNLLTGITSFATFAIEALPARHPVATDLREVLSAAERAASLTQQLLAFARKQTIDPRVIDVNKLVAAGDRLLRRLLGADIDIVTRLADGLWLTLIDGGAFEQVLINLAVNARDAMPNGGRLTVETSNALVDQAHSPRRGGDIPAGDYVVLAVSDDGVGMDEATQRRIFEPFFTTKEVGKGTGLGLATCYGIVRQAAGHIWVYSEPGQGTTFKIYLPRSLGAAAEALPPPKLEKNTAGRGETVLVVEDDPRVRQVIVRSLSPLGYHLLVAGNAREAVGHCETHRGSIDLLLTDVVMPEVSGRELSARLTARFAGLRTLFVSGYTEAAIAHRGALPSGTHLLAKPFTPRALAERVREVLDLPS
jgi:two-component system cell cycle sensor histidine kinase/response regulator CckA